MKYEKIIEIVKKEFTSGQELFSEKDALKIDDSFDLYFYYESSKYTDCYDERGNLSDRGVTHISFKIKPKERECWITGLGVNPKYERQGLARKMVGAVETISKNSEIPIIILENPLTDAFLFWNRKMNYKPRIYRYKQTFRKRL